MASSRLTVALPSDSFGPSRTIPARSAQPEPDRK
jgi:hypothetical protein